MKKKCIIFFVILVIILCWHNITSAYEENDDYQGSIIISEKTKLNQNDAENVLKYLKNSEESLLSNDASTPEGWVDDANGDRVAGWAWRRDKPNEAITVHLYIYQEGTNNVWGPVGGLANGYRSDLEQNGYGNGKHTFNFKLYCQESVSGRYKAIVFGIGDNGNPALSGCPKYFDIADPEGFLDVVNDNEISGWAWRKSSPNDAVIVKIHLGNTSNGKEYIKEVNAKFYRQDLKDANIGNGYHRFNYAIDWTDYPPGKYWVSAYAYTYDKDYELYSSPKNYLRKAVAYLAGGVFENCDDKTHNINSTKVINSAKSVYEQMGFIVNNNINPNHSTLISKLQYNRKKLESDIVLLTTHGSCNFMDFKEGGLITGGSTQAKNEYNTYIYATGTEEFNWKKTTLVLLIGCKTGDENPVTVNGQKLPNLVQDIYNKGAGEVIGFKEEIRAKDIEKWVNSFNQRLQEGKTFLTCISNTLAQSYIDDCIKNIYFLGDSTLFFNSNGYATLNTQINEQKFNSDIKYYSESDIKNINDFMIENYNKFNLNDYYVSINIANINEKEYPIIDYKYKIGEFITNTGYVVLIRENKIFDIIDNTNLNLTTEQIDELKNFSVNNIEDIEKIKKDNIKELEKDSNIVKVEKNSQQIQLKYDADENKKYVEISTKVQRKIENQENYEESIEKKMYEI